MIKAPSDLLRVLLQRHYTGRVLPRKLDEHLVDQLRKTGRWEDWPLERIVPNRADFLQFLQERWRPFVEKEKHARGSEIGEGVEAYGLKLDGPVDLPFDHDDIRVYIDNLFVEGMLEPESLSGTGELEKTWMGVGLVGSSKTRRDRPASRSARQRFPV